jgi:hypothetical protein
MASSKYLTTGELINRVKVQGMIPISKKTFTDQDILSLANIEMDTGILPDILTYFESYLLYKESIPLETNQDTYDIPYRAIGMKLQDVALKDSNNNLFEMSRIQPDERIFFQYSQGFYTNNLRFYVENNSIVLVPAAAGPQSASLEMNYYMSPNKLVLEERVATASAVNYYSAVTCSSVASGDVLTINTTNLTAGVDFSVTGTDSQVASALLAAATGFTGSVSGSVVTFTGTTRLETQVNASSLTNYDSVILTCDQIPTNLVEGTEVDFIQHKPGFKTYDYDFELPTGSIDSNAKTITLPTSSLPRQFVKTDFIATAGETIIPQIPVELHPMLVQRVVCRCLEALGDTQGLANAKEKLAEMVGKMGNLIDNRVESAPQKIFNKGSPLRIAKFRQRSFFRY